MLEELPDLQELTGIGEMTGPPDMSTRAYPQAVLSQGNYQYHEDLMERDTVENGARKAIRGTQTLNPNSGMMPMGGRTPIQSLGGYAPESPLRGPENFAPPERSDGTSQGAPPLGFHPAMFAGIPCIEIARHIESCPICSKFFSTDKTLYLVAIGVLVVICILLLKKVLNV